MCSWCYGFSPEITRIKGEYQDVLGFKMVMAGLRTGTTQPMDEPTKDEVAHHWHQVHERTGQEFNFKFFQKENFVYDTEPACRAMVVVRHLRPAFEFEIFQALQHAFYNQAIDITKADGLVNVLLNFEIKEQDFLSLFRSDQIRHETQQDFNLARRIGASGFPSVYLQTGDQMHVITRGYRTFDNMKPIVDRVIHQIWAR